MKYKRTKLACYTSYFTMSSVFSFPPLLFVTFQNMYGISYTLLGTLVLANFLTQMLIDLIFTFFSKHFNVKKTVTLMPIITSVGLFIYTFSPLLFKEHVYLGFLIGTIIFSVSAGLSEVLLSPIIAAIPSDNPQGDMSFLHSLYAFGIFSVIVTSTLFLKIFGTENWVYLSFFWAILPLVSAVLFYISPIPEMKEEKQEKGEKNRRRTVALTLCVLCIFCGSCAEGSMSNWVSTFMESALNIEKTTGDILGMAGFAILLGLARILYAKYGKNIMPVLFFGMTGAIICYLTAGLSTNTYVAFSACALTGFFTAMLWPGTLIMMEENVKGVSVAAYALMASAGDLGASVAPQVLGIVTDNVASSGFADNLSVILNLTTEQIGLKAGMLFTAVFPVLGVIVLITAHRFFLKDKK